MKTKLNFLLVIELVSFALLSVALSIFLIFRPVSSTSSSSDNTEVLVAPTTAALEKSEPQQFYVNGTGIVCYGVNPNIAGGNRANVYTFEEPFETDVDFSFVQSGILYNVQVGEDGQCGQTAFFNFKDKLAELNITRDTTKLFSSFGQRFEDNSIIFDVNYSNTLNQYDIFKYDTNTNKLSLLKNVSGAIFGNYKFSFAPGNFSVIDYTESTLTISLKYIGLDACGLPQGQSAATYNKCMRSYNADSAKIEANAGIWMLNLATGKLTKLH